MLAGVAREWNAETKLKVKCLEQSVTEKVLLNHTEMIHWTRANSELHSGIRYVYISLLNT